MIATLGVMSQFRHHKSKRPTYTHRILQKTKRCAREVWIASLYIGIGWAGFVMTCELKLQKYTLDNFLLYLLFLVPISLTNEYFWRTQLEPLVMPRLLRRFGVGEDEGED